MSLAPACCPGPCNTAYRKAEEALAAKGTDHAIQPAWGQPAQCYDCVDRTRQHLAELPKLLADVLAEATEGTPAKLTGTIGRITVAVWPGQNPRLLVDGIISGMAELEGDVLKQRGIWPEDHPIAPGTGPNEERRIAGLVATLGGHWDWAMQNHPAAWEPWGRDNANPGGQVAGWHRTCQFATKQDEQRDVKRLAPCPRCHGPYLIESRDLRLVNDQPYIECRDPDCGRIITRREYDAYVKALNESILAAA